MSRDPGGAGQALLVVSLLSLLCAAVPSSVQAQPPEPLRGFVVDARGSIPFYPRTDQIATDRETTQDQLSRYGLGAEFGGHVFPFHWKQVTFGFGASYLMSRGSRTPPTPDGETEPSGPTVETRFQAFAPQVSLNFGHRMGWSTLSAGYGTALYRAWRADLAEDEGTRTTAINFGGGARWFVNDHLAVSLDLRFHRLGAQPAAANAYGHPAMQIVVLNAGVAFR